MPSIEKALPDPPDGVGAPTPAAAARLARIATAVSATVTGLTLKQRTFLVHLLCHGNASQAAAAAGYAYPGKAGPRLRHHAKIQAAIDEYFHAQEMSAQEVIARLSQQARAEYGDYLYYDDRTGEVYCDLQQLLADGKGHLIKKVGYERTGRDTAVQVVEFYDAHQALVDVGKYHGLFGARGGEEDPLHTVGMTLEEWQAEQDRRRRQREADTADTLAIFEDDEGDADARA